MKLKKWYFSEFQYVTELNFLKCSLVSTIFRIIRFSDFSRDLKSAFRNIPILERKEETSHVNGRTFVEEHTSVLFLASQAKVDAWFENVVSERDVIFVPIFLQMLLARLNLTVALSRRIVYSFVYAIHCKFLSNCDVFIKIFLDDTLSTNN